MTCLLVSQFYRLFGAKYLLAFLFLLNLPCRSNPADARSRGQLLLWFLMYKVLCQLSLTSAFLKAEECRTPRQKHVVQTAMSEIPLLRNKVCLASVLTLAIRAIISSPDAVQFERVWLKRLKK